MSRPRIRTLKPEMWQDENIGDLSRDARLTLVGLVTMADDEGRLRARPAAVIGHIFPWDDDVTPQKLERWLAEVEQSGVILRYQGEGKPYIAFRHWKRHQKVNRANDSELPPPPDHDVVTDNSVNDHESITDRSRPRAHARVRSDPIPSDPVLQKLYEVAEARGIKKPSAEGIAKALADYPDRDHLAVACDLEFWALHGGGAQRTKMALANTYRNFLKRAEPANVKPIHPADARIAELREMGERFRREDGAAA